MHKYTETPVDMDGLTIRAATGRENITSGGFTTHLVHLDLSRADSQERTWALLRVTEGSRPFISFCDKG